MGIDYIVRSACDEPLSVVTPTDGQYSTLIESPNITG